MEDKIISFSKFIKDEIINFQWSEKDLSILFYAFLRSNGTYRQGNYIVTTTLIKWEVFFNNLFLKNYGLEIKPIKSKTMIKYIINDPLFLEKFATNLGELVIESLSENKAYIAGTFLGKGWVSSPSSRFYHCEVRVRNLYHSLDVQEAFDGLGIKISTTKKNKWYYTYIKKSGEISKLISAVNASQAVMYFEDSRIERDFVATFKKMESIENYNLEKSFNSSEKHIKAVKKILNSNKFDALNINMKEIINLRIEEPTHSLSELQMDFNERNNTDYSKSTINNWLNKLLLISKDIK